MKDYKTKYDLMNKWGLRAAIFWIVLCGLFLAYQLAEAGTVQAFFVKRIEGSMYATCVYKSPWGMHYREIPATSLCPLVIVVRI